MVQAAQHQPAAPPPSLDGEWSDAALLARLRHVMGGMSQSELARKTGFSQQNINRYLGGGKIPISFANALVRKLDVNPAWLLTGEGAPTLSAVTQQTTTTASHLLDLVKAMNSVMNMKLGELVGKEREKIFYELNERLTAYEDIRRRLDKEVEPFLKGLLEDLEALLKQGAYRAAQQPLQAAQQASRLCQDELLHARLDSFHATVAWGLGDIEDGLRLSRRAFNRYFSLNPDIGSMHMRMVYDYLVALRGHDQRQEADRVCRAMLVRCEHLARESAYWSLTFWSGVLDIESCRVKEGLGKLLTSYATLPQSQRDFFWPMYTRTALTAGVITLKELLGEDVTRLPSLNPSKRRDQARTTLMFAAINESPDELDRAWKLYHTHLGEDGSASKDWRRAYICALVRESGERRNAYKLFRDNQTISNGLAHYPETSAEPRESSVCACHLARFSGNMKAARAELLKADAVLIGLPSDITPYILITALHYRNAYKLASTMKKGSIPAELLRRGAAFFKTHVAAGYHIFTADAREASAVVPAE